MAALLRCALLAVAALATTVTNLEEQSEPIDQVSFLQHTAGVTTIRSNIRSNNSQTPLTLFRDAVVRRPTPPSGYVSLPEFEEMKLQSSQTPEAQSRLCNTLNGVLSGTPSLQEPMYIQGVHQQAIQAMRTFSDRAEVQTACSNLLANMVQWNWVLARALADDGALDVMVAAMRRFPDVVEVRSLSGALGSFCDFDIQNKQKLGDLGLVEQVYAATDAHYTLSDVAQMYNFWSTVCSVPSLAVKMVEGNSELERGVRAMKTFRTGTVRGEVIMVHSACFTGTPAWRQRMVQAGIVPEILSAMHDEMSGAEGELDTVGKPRLLFNGLNWLSQLTQVGPEARAEMVDQGAVEVMVDALRDGNAHGHGFEEMQHDVRGKACDTLAELMVDGPRQLEPLARAREELAELPAACSNLLTAVG